MTPSHLELYLFIHLLGPSQRQFRPDFWRCWAINSFHVSQGELWPCSTVLDVASGFRKGACMRSHFKSLHSESKFIANRDLNYFCVIYSLYERSKESKQIFYVINRYHKENPGLLNPTLLRELLARCLNI